MLKLMLGVVIGLGLGVFASHTQVAKAAPQQAEEQCQARFQRWTVVYDASLRLLIPAEVTPIRTLGFNGVTMTHYDPRTMTETVKVPLNFNSQFWPPQITPEKFLENMRR